MQMTIDSSRGIAPRSISCCVAATVTPPAGSVKMPSVSASSWMPSMISSSVDHRAGAAGRAHRAQHLEAVGRIADGDRLGDRVRLDRIGKLEAGVERADDRRAAGRLRRVDRRQLALDQADGAELLEALEDARQQRAAGDRRDDVLREAPAELLGDLEAVGLRALGVVRAQVDVGEPPAVLVRHLRAQPVHVVVVAADGDDVRPIDAGAGDLAGSRSSGMKT